MMLRLVVASHACHDDEGAVLSTRMTLPDFGFGWCMQTSESTRFARCVHRGCATLRDEAGRHSALPSLALVVQSGRLTARWSGF